MQLCHLPHKPFIFWWNLVPVTDLSISCRSITQTRHQGPAKTQTYLPICSTWHAQLVGFFYVSFLLPWLLWGLTQSPQSGSTELLDSAGLELGRALQISDTPFSKQSLVSKLKCFKSPFLDAYTETSLPTCMWGMKCMWSMELDQKSLSHQQS